MPPSELGASQRPREVRRKRFAYDVFLSHNAKDKPAVRELAERLKQDGLRVWFDEWVIQPGDSIPLKIEQGLEQSRTLILIMSQNAFTSEWVALERYTALFRDPTNAERRFIPLRLDDAEITDTLKQFAYIDWRYKTQEQYARLLTACRPMPAETKPTRKRQQHSPAVKVLKGHTDKVLGVAITPDGQWAVSSSRDRTVRVWELATGRCLTTLKGRTGAVNGVAITPDGQRVVSGSDDATVRVWDLAMGECLASLEGHAHAVSGVAVTTDGQRAVSISSDRTMRVWDLATGECLTSLRGPIDRPNHLAVTADGQRAVISGPDDRTVRVWDLAMGECLATLKGHTNGVTSVAVTADGQRAVSGSFDRTVRVWDLAMGECLATLKGHTDSVVCVAVTADGRRAVSGSVDRTVQVWDLPPIAGESLQAGEAARYTNAKVLLVGESGVGKSGPGVSAHGRSVRDDYFNGCRLGDTIAAAIQHR